MPNILSEQGMLECIVVDAPMKANVKLLPEGEILNNPYKYQRLVGELNYLTITRADIAFVVSVMSQFLSTPRTTN